MGENLFLSAHGSVLCKDENGTLDHRYFQGAEPELRFGEDGHLLHGQGGVPPQLASAVPLPDGRSFAFRSDEGFLSAEETGGFRWASEVSDWERYRLVPLASLEAWRTAQAPAFPRRPRRRTIDRILHQTYSPNVAREMLDGAKRLSIANEDWEHRLYSEEDRLDFIHAHFGWDVLKYYIKIHPNYGAARADFFRYLCLYQHGGLYLDIKSSCERPLSEVIAPSDEYILCQWNNGPETPHFRWGIWHELLDVSGGEYQQWNIAAAAGHPFLEAVIEAMLKNIVGYDAALFGTGREGTLRLTGPIMYTRAIHPIREQHRHRLIDADHNPFIYNSVGTEVLARQPHYSQLRDPLVI